MWPLYAFVDTACTYNPLHITLILHPTRYVFDLKKKPTTLCTISLICPFSFIFISLLSLNKMLKVLNISYNNIRSFLCLFTHMYEYFLAFPGGPWLYKMTLIWKILWLKYISIRWCFLQYPRFYKMSFLHCTFWKYMY